jgi:hypothetical protein
LAASFADFFATSKAVLTHACHHHGEHVLFEYLSRRAEEDIRRRAARIFRRAIKYLGVDFAVRSFHNHVPAAGGQPRVTSPYSLIGARFRH